MIHYYSSLVFEKYTFKGCKVIELGDQLMDAGEDFRYKRSDEHYTDFSIQSIDWHGKNRALKLDLTQELEERFEADILSDFGTIEHCTDLYNPLLNAHNFTKVGGIMIHVNPKTGTYPAHGCHWFTQEFWIDFAKLAGYELLEVYEKQPYSIDNPDVEVYAVLKKTSQDFISREKFEKMAKGKVFTS